MIAFPDGWRIAAAIPLANGIGGRVWRVTREDGSTAVAKQLSEKAQADGPHALAYLDWRGGHGAVRLLEDSGGFQLLEDAGTVTLASVIDREGDDAATDIAAQVLKRLHASHDRAPPDLPDMRMRFSALFDLARTASEPLYREAADRVSSLLASPARVHALHGDIHHDNILMGPRGWLAIDPHGVSGDPAYDAANLFYNPVERHDLRTDTARARRMAERLATAVGRPAEVVLDYGFCHACLSSAWHLEDDDAEEAALSLDVARAIRPLLIAA